MTSGRDDLKRMAAVRAVEEVASGMVVGLGSGSTARQVVMLIGEMLLDGRLEGVTGVPTSETTANLAEECSIPLATLEATLALDLTIDGADEVDPGLNLIKGLGGALLREKIVAVASERLVIVVDETKLVPALGTRAPVPVEVIPFGWQGVAAFLESLGANVVLRTDPIGRPFVTDEGNYILDCMFCGLENPEGLALEIKSRPGVVEHGLFLGIATEVIVASREGVRVLTR